jgi:hypothetical protein
MAYEQDRETLDKWVERKLEPREVIDGMPQAGPLRARQR